MKYLFNIFIGCLFLLAGCGKQKNKMLDKIDQINAWSKDVIQTPLMPNAALSDEEIRNLTQKKAFELALRNNQAFLAQLEELGIKNGDLIQAGFFKNPTLETIFLLPNPAEQADIEVNARFSLSDFWQVPLRTKIAEDALTIKTFEIMTSMLNLKKNIHIAFHQCIFEKMRYRILQKTVEALQSLKEHLEYRFQFGFGTDLDIYGASVELSKQQSNLIRQEGILHATLYDLQYLIGIYEPYLCISTEQIPTLPKINISSQELFFIAKTHHPDLLAHDIAIRKAHHTIHYEKSRIFDTVDVGISYERDFEKNNTGIGPSFFLNVPLFNQNYGNIERARHELEKAHFNFQNNLRFIQNTISSIIARYTTLLATIERYSHDIFPALRKAITYTEKQMHLMQLPTPIVIDTYLKYLQAGQEFITYLQEASMLYAKLEQAVGKSLLV